MCTQSIVPRVTNRAGKTAASWCGGLAQSDRQTDKYRHAHRQVGAQGSLPLSSQTRFVITILAYFVTTLHTR